MTQRPAPGAAEDLAIVVARLATIALLLRERLPHAAFCPTRSERCACVRGAILRLTEFER